ncbi:hypothetical protein [Peptostreptococcus anaerobius]|uniref:hypothetical protein n=1 Tax=Peptostreptococcus anaerobius TaxID=1261 RepID=UPI0028FEFC64|nr:hypothetical protein [Peptostreptococcus anaerobius]MDU1599441.1 hypothetical protein [Peptostreptococcus anaerobius]MDU1683002.1 hypothetical protein [Peptostreptococcus anaerobius]
MAVISRMFLNTLILMIGPLVFSLVFGCTYGRHDKTPCSSKFGVDTFTGDCICKIYKVFNDRGLVLGLLAGYIGGMVDC